MRDAIAVTGTKSLTGVQVCVAAQIATFARVGVARREREGLTNCGGVAAWDRRFVSTRDGVTYFSLTFLIFLFSSSSRFGHTTP